MARHHTIISGTGRAGTTFLMQLFTHLGLPTGFSTTTEHVYKNCNAGMEWDIRDPRAPYLIKNPQLCDNVESILESEDISIDHAIIPMRDLFSAAQSRRSVTQRTDAALFPQGAPGGLWMTQEPGQQEVVLTNQLYKLIHALTKHDIPMTFLYFPRLAREPDYLYHKLQFLLQEMDYGRFTASFNAASQPELIHTFESKSPAHQGNQESHFIRNAGIQES